MSIERRPLAAVHTAVVKEHVREPTTESRRSAAFQQLADRNLFACYKLATAILGDPSESQDAVHDAVVVAWQRFESLRDQARFEAWFQRIVVNTCRDRLRRSARRRASDIDEAAGIAGPDDSRAVQDRIVVEQALSALDPDDQVILALRHYLDLEIADIGRLLDVPTKTANSRLRAARARLRAAVDQGHPTGAAG